MLDSTLCIKEIKLLNEKHETVRCKLSYQDMLTLSSLLIFQGGVPLEFFFYYFFFCVCSVVLVCINLHIVYISILT